MKKLLFTLFILPTLLSASNFKSTSRKKYEIALAKLQKTYIKNLKSELKRYTQTGKLDEAMSIKEELKKAEEELELLNTTGAKKAYRLPMRWDTNDLKKFIETNEFVAYDTLRVPIKQRIKVTVTFRNGWQFINNIRTNLRYKVTNKQTFIRKAIDSSFTRTMTLHKSKKYFTFKAGHDPIFWL